MKLLIIDQLRKIRQNKWQFLSMSLLVFIISFTYTASKASVRRLEENYEEYLETQQVEDFNIVMGELDVNYLGGTAIYEICQNLEIMYECGIAFAHPNDPSYLNWLNTIISQKVQENPLIYESIMDEYIDDFSNEYNFVSEKQHVTTVLDGEFIYKFLDINEQINIPYVVEGTLPENDYEIMVFPEFGEIHNLSIGDTYEINDTTYTITGFFYSPEYTFPLFSLSVIAFDEEVQTMVLTTEETMYKLPQYISTKYVVHGDIEELFGDLGYDTLQSGDYSFLGKQLQVVRTLMPRDINLRIISLQLEVDNANTVIDIFLPLFLSFVTILLIVFMKRYIEKNEDDIYTLHAIGYKNNELAISLLVFPFLVSIVSFIGYLTGMITSNYLFDLYAKRYLFPKAGFTIDFDIFFFTTISLILIIVVLNYIFIMQSLQFKKKNIKRIKINMFKFTPLKTITITFILFITINIMMTFGLNGNSIFNEFIDHTKQGNHYKEMVDLRYMTNEDHLDTYEEYTKSPGKIIEVNAEPLKQSKTTTVYGIDVNNSLKRLIEDNLANNLLLEEGIIISDYLKSSLNLKIGDDVKIQIGGVEIQEKVVGISNELIENNLFMLQSKLNNIYQYDETYYNGLYLDHDGYQNPLISVRIDYQQSLDEIANVLNTSSIILNIILVLSVILSLYIFVLVLISFFKDNNVNIAILKSLGYYNFEINKKYLTSIYLILIVTFILSIPITNYLLQYLVLLLMDRMGYKLVVSLSVTNVIIGFIVLNSLFFIVIHFANKYYDTIQVSSLLKHNIK